MANSYDNTELDENLADDASQQDEVSEQDAADLRNVATQQPRMVPGGATYEKNTAFASLLVKTLGTWWSADATPLVRATCREALGMLLRYGFATAEMTCLLPEDYELRYPEVDPVEARASVEAARVLVDEVAEGKPTAAQLLGEPLAQEFSYEEGHASLLALWQLSSVYCRLYLNSPDYAPARQALEETAELLDLDSPRSIPTCLEGIICYLGFFYPEINKELAVQLASSIDSSLLSCGLMDIAPNYVETLYYRMRRRSGLIGRIPSRGTLGVWALTHKLQWDLTKLIQGYNMQILADIDAFCRERGIRYFLCEGALLGAMRGSGPIPWDDDIDLGLLREDYDRFVAEAPEYFAGKYAIDTYETNPTHWTISGKVQMLEDTGYISLKAEGLALSSAPFVDIFAFDESPVDDGPELIKRGRRISALRALLYERTGFQKRPSVRKAMRKRVLSKFTPVDYLHKEIDERCRAYQGQDCPYVSNFGSLYKVEMETFAVEDMLPLRTVPYGDLQVNVPNNAEAMLDKIYGDWHELPPYATRLGKHRFIKREDYEAELAKHVAGV